MKLKLPSLVCVLALAVSSAFAQSETKLTRFNLDFPGGTAAELAQAIRKASGKPCNLVVAPQSAELRLPALKLEHVTTQDLFEALKQTSQVRHPQSIINGEPSEFTMVPVYLIHTSDQSPTDDTIWYLAGDPFQEPAISRFYNLAPYLTLYTVDDITTALKTAWGLAGGPAPKMTFHKETKLLIVVGTQAQLNLVEQELEALNVSVEKKPPVADKAEPKPAEAAKQ